MKAILAMLMCLLLVLGLAACTGQAPEQTQPETTAAKETQELLQPETTDAQPVLQEGTPDYFQISFYDENENYGSLSAYEDGTGQVTVDYQGDIRKVTTMDPSVMDQIAEELKNAGLWELNGENIYEDGMASASVYLSYPEGSSLAAGYGGTIPQAFLDGYAHMEKWFQELLADVEEYVPRPLIGEGADPEAQAELVAILDASGMEPLDMFSIQDVPLDEYFTMMMGLSDTTGILNGTSCSPVMSATAYSCVVVTVEDESVIPAVQQDFAANVDWNHWVCVSANSALIARKGNLVLCLVGEDMLYQMTADAITANGWTVLETLSSQG